MDYGGDCSPNLALGQMCLVSSLGGIKRPIMSILEFFLSACKRWRFFVGCI